MSLIENSGRRSVGRVARYGQTVEISRVRITLVARVLVAVLAAGIGCGGRGDTSNEAGQTSEIARRTSALTALARSGWTASASTTGGTNVAGNAIDGSTTTRWRANAAQATNQWFQVDMASPRTFVEISLDTSVTSTEYPRNFKVQVANDNLSWATAPTVATGTGTTAVTTIAFAPQTARYVRVTLTMPNAAFWSIYDFNVYGTALSRTGWTATASSTNGTNAAQNALDGTTTTRWSSAGAQTDQWFKVDMKIPRTFNQIILDAGTTTNNYPRGHAVFVSNDDMNWTPAVATGTGTTAFMVITFAFQHARYIRIDQTVSNAATWSIQELNVEGQPTTPTTQPRAGWIATASSFNPANPVNNAIDGVTTTRWSTAAAQTNQWFQVDMRTSRIFDQITLDAGTSTNNFPRAYQVQVSNDGTAWTTVTTGTGTAALVTINLTPARTAQYIRITQTATNTNPWTIQEMNVRGAGLSSIGWVATGLTTNMGNVANNAIDGSATTRWSSLGAQTGEWFKVDMGAAQIFNQLTLDAGTTLNNFPRGYSVQVSNDGTNWGTAVATGTGTSQLVTITFAPQTARLFRINQTATNGATWSIQELTVWRIAGLCDQVTCTASNACRVAGVCDPNTGACSSPPADNGTPCNDNDMCTRTDTCQAGTCTGGGPVTCPAADGCQTQGACVPATGCPALVPKAPGESCGDTNACNGVETCTAGGVCEAQSSPTCFADVPIGHLPGVALLFDVWGSSATDIHVTGSGGRVLHRGTAGVVSGQQIPGTSDLGRLWGTSPTNVYTVNGATVLHLDETGNWSAQPTSATGQLLAVWGSSATDIYAVGKNAGIFHSTGAGDWPSQGNSLPGNAQVNAVRGSGASDVYAVGSDALGYGFVVHRGSDNQWLEQDLPASTPGLSNVWVVSSNDIYAVGQSGVILHSTGNGSWVRQQSGVSNPLAGIWAPAAGTPVYVGGGGGTLLRSHGAGVWTRILSQEAAGAGVVFNGLWGDSPNNVWAVGLDVEHPVPGGYPPIFRQISADGSACGGWDDGNPCTTDSCNPVAGFVQGYVQNGVSCSDLNVCNGTEVCNGSGSCLSGSPLVCLATEACDTQLGCLPSCPAHPSVCVGPGVRDAAAGTCTYAALPDGTGCSDGNACTQTDTCLGGACRGANLVACVGASGGGQCETPAICNPNTGSCVNAPVPDGFACNDSNACTQTDSCRNGACVGENPVVCSTSDQCHAVGICDSGTGQCSNPAVTDGAPCDDGSACTETDTCVAGSCSGGVSSCAPAQAPPEETLTSVRFEEIGLQMAPDDNEIATGINNAGMVVGYAQGPDGRTWAWRHNSDASSHSVILSTVFEQGSKALGVSDGGQIVGVVDPAENPIGMHSIGTHPQITLVEHTHGFSYVGGPFPFNILTPAYGSALAINNAGEMAVVHHSQSGNYQAFTIDASGEYAVAPPSGTRFTGNTRLLGIGPGVGAVAVGSAETFDEMTVYHNAGTVPETFRITEAILVSRTGGVHNLNSIPASRDREWKLHAATATNGRQIVGWGTFVDNQHRVCRAFRWTPLPGRGVIPTPALPDDPQPSPPSIGANIVDLGILPGLQDGNCNERNTPYIPDAINARGEVVGSVRETAAGGAFFYSDATGMINLTNVINPALGYSLRTATGINDRGQIVGTFTKAGETKVRAYRLSLPPMYTSGPVAQFDWKMKPHFPGTDRVMAVPPPEGVCFGETCRTAQGNPACRPVIFGGFGECTAFLCQPGTIASCRTSCGSVGTEVCGSNGHWGTCVPGTETCDGADDNCDGRIDEDGICVLPRSSFDASRRGFDVTLEAIPAQWLKSPIISCEWTLPNGVHRISEGCVSNVIFPGEGPFPVTLTVRDLNGIPSSETHEVTIRNVIIASIGDSIASGEGSPDVSAAGAIPVRWWNRRCHRSLLSGPALTARALEDVDQRTSVTFISRACSGARIVEGLTEPYGGIEAVADTVPNTVGDGDRDANLTPQIEAVRSQVGSRQADALLVQIGMNDARFSSVILKCAKIEGIGQVDRSDCYDAIVTADMAVLALGGSGPASYARVADKVRDLTKSPSRVYVSDYPDPTRITMTVLCDEIILEGAVDDQTGGWNLVPSAITLGQTFGDDAILDASDIAWASAGFLRPANLAIETSASTWGWTYVPGVSAAFIGRSMCSANRAFVQYNESLERQGNKEGVFHPNLVGQRIYASHICPVVARALGFSSARCTPVP